MNRASRTAAALLPLWLLSLACEGTGPEAGTISTDSAGILIVTSDPLASSAVCPASAEPTLTIGALEGPEPEMLHRVSGVTRLSDGSIAIADDGSSEVRLFDSAGAHRGTMGGRGDGPGEFHNPRGIWALPGDTLWVGDYRPWRFNVFSADGRWVRAVPLNPPYLNPSRQGGVLSAGISVNTRSLAGAMDERFDVWDTLLVELHGADGAWMDVLSKLPNARWGSVSEGADNYSLSPLFEGRPTVDARGGTIAIANREPEVRLFDAGFRLRHILRWTEPGRRVTGADVSAYRDGVRKARREAGRELSEFDVANLSEERPVSELFPAVSRVLVGVGGRIWVRPYRSRGDQEPGTQRWMVFDPEEGFRCRVDLTAGLRIFEVGADYVLGRSGGDMDVERVALYGLGPPEG